MTREHHLYWWAQRSKENPSRKISREIIAAGETQIKSHKAENVAETSHCTAHTWWTGWRPRHGETVLCWRSEQGRKEHNTRVCSIAWHCSKAMQWHTELAKTEFNFYTLKKKSDSGRGLLMQKFFFNMLWQQLENIEVRWLIQIWKALENTHVAMPENAGRKMPYIKKAQEREITISYFTHYFYIYLLLSYFADCYRLLTTKIHSSPIKVGIHIVCSILMPTLGIKHCGST